MYDLINPLIMNNKSNDWYLDGLKKGDEHVTKAIFSDFAQMVDSFVVRNRGTKEDARDIFMDGLEALYRRLKKGDLDLTCSFGTFLFAICKRLWFKKIRRKKFDAGVTLEDLSVLKQVEEIVPWIEQTERYRLMREKFEKLGEDCKKVLDLAWHSDLGMEEIANKMGWTYGYARKRKHDCQERLKGLVKADVRFNELLVE